MCQVHWRNLVPYQISEAVTRTYPVQLTERVRGENKKKKEGRLDVGGRKGCRLSLPHSHIDYLPLKFTVSLAAVLRTVLPATQG